MNSKRMFSALLAALMLAPLASCGDTAEANTDDTADTAAVETEAETTEEEARLAMPDNLPDKDYEGSDFTVCATATPAG